MKCLAFVLKDLFACHVFGLEHTALGWAMHMFHQVAVQLSRQQGVLLLDKCAGSGVGQVLDGFTAQNRQFAST
ncbi:hypothetical protein D3C80_1525360 [compost metagenome]